MMIALTIIHVIISIALVLVVLLQHGKQQGLSGAIAGGAETFFGKNKGRTIDAMLKKFTAVIAILFIVSSIVFTTVAVKQYKDTQAPAETTETATEDAQAPSLAGMTFFMNDGETPIVVNEDGQTFSDKDGNTYNVNEEGNIVDGEGNVVLSSENLQNQLNSMMEAAQAAADAEAATEEVPAEEAATETEAAAE